MNNGKDHEQLGEMHWRYVEESHSTHESAHKDSQPWWKSFLKSHFTLHDLRWAFLGVGVAFIVLTAGTAYVNKKIVNELQEKDQQVNSLIEEVGELKQDNLTLYTQLNANTEAVTAIQENIARLKERVQLVDQSDAFALQSQVETLNNDLNTQSVALKSLINAGLTFSGFSKVEAQESFEVLILGTHGRLTDTVMLASVNAETEKINLVSIPRDLVVGGRRINESFYRFGIDEVRNQIEDVTGLYPEKYVVIDMKSFEDLVDALGGIDVQVKKDLYDSMYPGPNYTYETLNIKAGNHHFDGVTALKYARSRKSTTDFDRAARQQEIIESLKTKILSTNPLTNVDQVIGIYDSLKESVQTDIDLWALISYIRQYSEYEVLGGHVLSTSNYLYPTTGEGGAYLLVPKAGDFSEIQAYVAGVVNGEEVNEDEVQK